MLQILIDFVFKIIGVVAGIVFSPLILLLNTFVPSLGDTLTNIILWLDTALENVPFLMRFLVVPTAATSIFFTYILAKYSFYLSYVVVKFAIKAYQKLKP